MKNRSNEIRSNEIRIRQEPPVLWFHLMNISSAAAQLDIKSLALDHPRPIMVIIKQQLTWKKKKHLIIETNIQKAEDILSMFIM